jgi:hypothetical protein
LTVRNGDLLPRNLVLGEQARFDGLVAWREHVAQEPGPVEQVHLAHARHAQHREQAFHRDLGAGFFVVSRAAPCSVVRSVP